MKSNLEHFLPSQISGFNRDRQQRFDACAPFSNRPVDFSRISKGYDSPSQQISGSLQDIWQGRSQPEIFERAISQLVQSSQILNHFSVFNRDGGQNATLPVSFRSPLSDLADAVKQKKSEEGVKVVASFIGKVECFLEDSAHVLLLNEQTGERLESRCDLDVLREKGIEEDGWFKCEVIRKNGDTIARLSRLPMKKLSKEQIDRICEQYKDRWTF